MFGFFCANDYFKHQKLQAFKYSCHTKHCNFEENAEVTNYFSPG